MSALTILGYCCLILFFTAIPVSIIVGALKDNPDAAPVDDEAHRELENNRVYIWEYFILILPVVFISFGLLSNDHSEKQEILVLLGIGLSGLLFSSYNNRFDIAGVNRIVIAVCIMCALTSVYLSRLNFNDQLASGKSVLVLLWFPLAIYIYLRIVREIIYEVTGSFPLTLGRNLPIGHFSERYNRKANYWDLLWTLWNFVLCVCLLFL